MATQGLIVISHADEITPTNLMHNFYYLRDYISVLATDPLIAAKIAANNAFVEAVGSYLAQDTAVFIPNLANQLITLQIFIEQLGNYLIGNSTFFINLVEYFKNNVDFLENLSFYLGDTFNFLENLAHVLARDTAGVNLENTFFIVGNYFEIDNIQIDSSLERTKKSVPDKLQENCDGSEWHIIFDSAVHFKIYRIDIPTSPDEEWVSNPPQTYLDEHYAGEGIVDQLVKTKQYLDITTCNLYSTGNINRTTGVIHSYLENKQPGWEEINIVQFRIKNAYNINDHFVFRTFNRDLGKYGFIANLGIFFSNYTYFKEELTKFILKNLQDTVGILPNTEKVSSIVFTSKIGTDQILSYPTGGTINYIEDISLNGYPEHYFDEMAIWIKDDNTGIEEIRKISTFSKQPNPRLILETPLSFVPNSDDIYKILYCYKDIDEDIYKVNNQIGKNVLEGEFQLYVGEDRDIQLAAPFLLNSIEILPLKDFNLESAVIIDRAEEPCRIKLDNSINFNDIPLKIAVNLGEGLPKAYIVEKDNETKYIYLASSPLKESPDNSWRDLGWNEPDINNILYFREIIDDDALFDFEIYGDVNRTILIYQKINNRGALSDIRNFWVYSYDVNNYNYGKLFIRLVHKGINFNKYNIRIFGINISEVENQLEEDFKNAIAQIKGVPLSDWAEDVPFELSLKGLALAIGENALFNSQILYQYDNNNNISNMIVMDNNYSPSRVAYEYEFNYNANNDISYIITKIYNTKTQTLYKTIREDFIYDNNGNIEYVERRLI